MFACSDRLVVLPLCREREVIEDNQGYRQLLRGDKGSLHFLPAHRSSSFNVEKQKDAGHEKVCICRVGRGGALPACEDQIWIIRWHIWEWGLCEYVMA